MVSFGGLARAIFGSSNDRRVKGLRPRVEEINRLPDMATQVLCVENALFVNVPFKQG